MPPTSTASQSSDIGAIWEAAVKSYNEDIQKEDDTTKYRFIPHKKHPYLLSKDQFESTTRWDTDSMGRFIEDALDKASKGRHDHGWLDKTRQVLKKISSLAQGVVSVVGGLASSVFPPAPTISQVLIYVLQAIDKVSEMYNKVITFYETVSFLFERLSLLQNRMPSETAFHLKISRLFGTILEICAVGLKLVRSRISTFFKVGIQGDDGFTDKYKLFDQQMSDLESSIITATLGNVIQTGRDVRHLQQTMDVGVFNISVLMMQVATFNKKLDTISLNRSERHGVNSEEDLFMRDNWVDSGSRKFSALEYTMRWLSTGAELPLARRLLKMEQSYIQGTCVWVKQNEDFQNFLKGSCGLLFVEGKRSTGKSMMLFYILRYLRHEYQPGNELQRKSTVAYFNFGSDSGKVFSVQDFISCCVMQAAEQDAGCRKRLIPHIKRRKDNKSDCKCEEPKECDHRCWSALFKEMFSSKSTIVLILDEVDQLVETKELERLLRYLETAVAKPGRKLQVISAVPMESNVVITNLVTRLKIPHFTISLRFGEGAQKGSTGDLRKFVEARMESWPRLVRLTRENREKIIGKICDKAKDLVYADHALRLLNQRKPKSPKLEDRLKTLPDNTQQIHETLFAECESKRSQFEIKQLKNLFTWLAYAKGSFSLGGVKLLLKLTSVWPKAESGTGETDSTPAEELDLDTELDGRLSQLLILSPNDDKIAEFSVRDVGIEHVDDGDDSSFLTFSTASLRAHYRDTRAKDQVTAHALMFKMTTSILIMEKKTPESDAKQELISFASQYWFEYLDDIPMNINTKSENARIVVECIGDIFTHKEGEYIALKRMDKALNINKYRPSICGRSVDAAKKRAERVSKWAETGLQLEGPEKIRKTLEILKTGAGRVLLRVARAHVDNWSEAEHPLEAHASFRLAYRAIRDAYEVQPEFAKQYEKKFGKKGEPDPEVFKPELFFAVSDDFGEWSKDETATECRCRSLALRYECHYKQALEQAQRGLSEAQKSGNKREEFDLWLRVGRICLGMSEDLKRIHSMFPKIGLLLDFVKRLLDEVAKSPGDREKSLDKSNPHPEMSVQTKIETLLKESVGEDSKKVSPDATYKRALNIGCLAAVEKAVSMGEEVREEAKRRGEGRAKSRSWEGKINNAYQLKIRAEILLQKFDDAMSTIGTTLKNNPDTSLIYFDDIVDFMGKEAEWEDISRLLGKVSKKQLVKGCKTSTHKFIQRAARISGGDDHLDELYNEAIKSLQKPPNPGPLNSMRLWYAIFEWSSSDSQKRATAEKLLNLARSPTEGGGIGVMTVASWQMLDVISYMFRLPGPPVQKETLRGEMERLVESVAEIQGSEFQPELSPMSIPLTIAYRKIGPAGAFYDRMQATFKACCSALEDDLVSNDASSLQVLTKVLALLPGLESEARIACTLQFYIVTESSSTQETNVGIPTSAEYAALDSEGISAPAADRSKSTRSEEPSTDEGARNDHDGGAQFDFNDHWSIQCSGSCGKSLTGSSITQPKENQPKKNPSSDSNQMNALYLCYHCTNTVLCSSCYEERKKLFVPCSVEHKHIQAPAENWQGVREGRLVFQTDKPGSHILFTDWMKKLKKKWEEAWMKYWGDV